MSLNQLKSKLNLEDFQELHPRYRRRLHASLTGLVRNTDDADDLTSRAFEAAWVNRASFRAEASPYTWLHSIARNEACQRRRNKISFQPLDGIIADQTSEPDRAIEALEKSNVRTRLRQALGNLPAKYRGILVDHFIHGHSVRRIAKRKAFRLEQS